MIAGCVVLDGRIRRSSKIRLLRDNIVVHTGELGSLRREAEDTREVREGFENHIVVTSDGRVVNGFLADKDNQVVVLRGVDGQNIILRQGEIDEMVVSKISIMPEGTLKALTAEQIRDLFAYLRSSQPVNY